MQSMRSFWTTMLWTTISPHVTSRGTGGAEIGPRPGRGRRVVLALDVLRANVERVLADRQVA